VKDKIKEVRPVLRSWTLRHRRMPPSSRRLELRAVGVPRRGIVCAADGGFGQRAIASDEGSKDVLGTAESPDVIGSASAATELAALYMRASGAHSPNPAAWACGGGMVGAPKTKRFGEIHVAARPSKR
jgi:hypothetical protein